MSKKIKNITITGMGIALFVVLTLCLQVPVFQNYYLCLGYIVMAVYLYSIGTVSGTIVGTLGVVLYCLLISGLRGMPGWALANVIIGILLGFTFKMTRKLHKPWLENIISVAAIVIGTAIGILIFKSGLESILYAQPFLVRTVNNIYAFVADVVVLIISLPVCRIMDGILRKIGIA
jgi:uncharacterized membrane protein